MNYTETIEFLFSRLPMFQRIGKAAYKGDLERTLRLDQYFGHPHRTFKTIHIAGTNGKGSVSHTIASVLQQAGYKTGLYTSPHLIDFRERIRIDGQMIDPQFVIEFVEKHRAIIEELSPSFFELTVALCFDYFAQQQIDIAVVETGLGGRLDSTNIIQPLLSVITNISKDHTMFLGDTLPLIATEKAGIVKANTPVVIGEMQSEVAEVFMQTAHRLNAPIVFADSCLRVTHKSIDTDFNYQRFDIAGSDDAVVYSCLKTDLMGSYQSKNILTVLAALQQLQAQIPIHNKHIYSGIASVIKTTGLLGRWQTLGNRPRIVCDTGHNEAGIAEVVHQIQQTPCECLHIVFGTVNDKDATTILRLLPDSSESVKYYFTNAKIERALDARTLQSMAADCQKHGTLHSSPPEALQAAKEAARCNDFIFIGGSTFVVADVLESL